MENKYYTPAIDEFHAGFECEIMTSYGFIKGHWPDTLKSDTRSSFIGTGEYEQTKYGTFRVKYLDKEDIKGLGFKGNDSNSAYFTKYNCLTSNGTNNLNCRLVHWINKGRDREVDIYAIYGKEDEQLIFRDVINNKSELVKLLKQLGIDE